MSTTVDFYLERAAESARAAKDTDLVNVRERCLRSEAVWRSMADRLSRSEQQKHENTLAKAQPQSPVETGDVPWPIAPTAHRPRPKDRP